MKYRLICIINFLLFVIPLTHWAIMEYSPKKSVTRIYSIESEFLEYIDSIHTPASNQKHLDSMLEHHMEK